MSRMKVTNYAVEIIKNYDTTDLLATLGAMNLYIDNQNKNYATSYYSTYILFNQNSGKPKASRKTLSLLVDELNKSNIIYSIQDPPEAPFFQKILYDRNYCVFNGVDHHAAFFVSRLCELFLFGDCSLLPNDFILIVRKIVKTALSLSDSIYKKMNLQYDGIMNYVGDKSIVLPPNIEQLKSFLLFDKSDLFQLGLSEEDIQRYVVFHHYPTLNLTKCLEKEIPHYYSRPFLDCYDKVLLIDPTAINTYIRYISIELAETFKCKKEFLNLMNEAIFLWGEWQIRKQIYKPIDEENHFINFNYSNTDTYKETIIPFSKSRMILYSACFNNFIEEKSISVKIDKYHSLIKKQLDELGKKYEVITILLGFSYGAGLNIREPNIFKNSNLSFTFDEFESVVINERNNPCFLFSAVNFVQTTKRVFPPTMGAINRIAFLRDRDYDFYIDDNSDSYFANLFVGFEYTYHYRVLASKEETTYVAPFYKQLIFLEKDSDNVYYSSSRFLDIEKIITFNKYPFGGFWVFAKTIDYNLITFVGTVNYWLTSLQYLLKNNVNNRFYYIELTLNQSNNIVISKSENTCVINVHPLIASLYNNKEIDEIDLIEKILYAFDLLTAQVKKQLESDRSNISKRYNTPLNTDQIMLIPYRKPLRPVFVSKYLSASLDDSIGRDYAMTKFGFTPGEKIRDADRFLKETVAGLFDNLEKRIKGFDWLSSIYFLYEYQEDYLQKLLINQKNMKVKHALYSNHISDINKIYYDLNSASPAIRFLLQYLASLQYEGEKTMDEVDLEILITLIHKIIHLANIDDGIVFNLLPNEMDFLQSKRLSIDLTNLELFNAIIAKEMIDDLTKEEVKMGDNQKWPFNKELNEAYLEEYGFTFDQMVQVIALLIAFGENQEENEIKTATIGDIIRFFAEFTDSKLIDESVIIAVINHLSISKRNTFFDPSVAKNREFYPWRYNRTESITRKPLIKYGDKIIWGNRTLYQCYVYTIGHIYEGNEPTKKPSNSKIKTLNGKVLELKGERFNDFAIDFLTKNIIGIDFYKGIKSFNNVRMKNEKGEFLGDIDILGIDKQKQRIYLIEVKNYQYSKNMAEIGFELSEFLGTSKNKGFIEKEMNRVNWVRNHLDDVRKEYNLENGNWKVFYTFLSSKPLLCSVFGKASFNNVSIDKISKKYLNNLI